MPRGEGGIFAQRIARQRRADETSPAWTERSRKRIRCLSRNQPNGPYAWLGSDGIGFHNAVLSGVGHQQPEESDFSYQTMV